MLRRATCTRDLLRRRIDSAATFSSSAQQWCQLLRASPDVILIALSQPHRGERHVSSMHWNDTLPCRHRGMGDRMSSASASAEPAAAKVGNYRWVICALLFFATTINYVDRAVLGVLAPTLVAEFGWSEQDYGVISASFTLAYAIGFLFA